MDGPIWMHSLYPKYGPAYMHGCMYDNVTHHMHYTTNCCNYLISFDVNRASPTLFSSYGILGQCSVCDVNFILIRLKLWWLQRSIPTTSSARHPILGTRCYFLAFSSCHVSTSFMESAILYSIELLEMFNYYRKLVTSCVVVH